MAISAQEVKALRTRTGAGMMDCKRALEETKGDIEAAIDILRSRGAAKVAKRAGKRAGEGKIGNYVHFGNRIGVLVEVNSETDFVANTEEFGKLAKELAMHIAAANPMGVGREDIPAELVERERQVFLDQVRNEGKPAHIQDRIVEGKMRKFFEENTLLEQKFVKDPDRTVQDIVDELAGTIGEKIEVARFVRFEVGEGP